MIGLEFQKVSFSYFNGRVLRDINLAVKAGEMVGLLGPNGSGKSTLIKLASGIIKSREGEIHLDGTSLRELNHKSIARRIAVVPQQFHVSFAFTVAEIVMLGRIPFLKPFGEESVTDKRLVSDMLELVGLTRLKERRFDELSGGERQKVILAMALAQEPKLILLDEPTAHLDITHQVEILELVKKLNNERGLTVLAAIHDLNLASLYFNRLILLKEGQIFADGTPSQVLTEKTIGEVFSASVRIEPHPATGVPHVVVMPKNNGKEHP